MSALPEEIDGGTDEREPPRTDDDTIWHEGGCLCGQTRYAVRGSPSSSSVCHCRSCRLASGATPVGWVVFPRSAFRWLREPPRTVRSSAQVSRGFCPACGTPLSYEHDEARQEIELTTATLDEPGRFPPTREIWLAEKVAWAATNPALTAFPHGSGAGL